MADNCLLNKQRPTRSSPTGHEKAVTRCPETAPENKVLRLPIQALKLLKASFALVSALKEDNKRQLRNAMDDLSLCVQSIALFEGCVDIEPLAANYSTLDRYIP